MKEDVDSRENPDTTVAEESGRPRFSTLKSMSVEPAGFLVVMSLVICHLIFQNLMMQTICQVDLGYPQEMCVEVIKNVNISYKPQEREIQKIMAEIQAITSPIYSGFTALIVLFVGPWSDNNGRRIPLLVSLAGLASFPLLSLLCYYLIGKISAIQLSLLAMVPITITGGAVVFAMSAYSYLSDTTTPKNRTVRTGILSAAMRSGTPLGFAVGGALTKFGVGVVPSLLFAAAVAIAAFLLLLFTIKDIKPVVKDSDPNRVKRSVWIRYNPVTKLIQAFAILVKKREKRYIFWSLIVCHVCYSAPGSGEYSMLYLFVRERLNWGISDYGFFSMANWLMSAGGVVLSMFILSKKLKISDPIVGFVGGLSQIAGSTMYAFAYTAVMMYAASAMDMMNGTMGVIARSMLSKEVQPDEVGKVFALLGVIESLLPLGMVPAYAMLYRSTATVFAGAFFFLSAGVTIPALLIFLYFICKKTQVGANKSRSSDEEIDQVKSADENKNDEIPEAVELLATQSHLTEHGISEAPN